MIVFLYFLLVVGVLFLIKYIANKMTDNTPNPPIILTETQCLLSFNKNKEIVNFKVITKKEETISGFVGNSLKNYCDIRFTDCNAGVTTLSLLISEKSEKPLTDEEIKNTATRFFTKSIYNK